MCEPIPKRSVPAAVHPEEDIKVRMPEEIDEDANAIWKGRIESNPDILFGKPVVKGTRLAVELIIDLLSWGWSESDILDNYPGLTHDDIRACLGYAGDTLRLTFSTRNKVIHNSQGGRL